MMKPKRYHYDETRNKIYTDETYLPLFESVYIGIFTIACLIVWIPSLSQPLFSYGNDIFRNSIRYIEVPENTPLFDKIKDIQMRKYGDIV